MNKMREYLKGLSDFEKRTINHCEKRERMSTLFGCEDNAPEFAERTKDSLDNL